MMMKLESRDLERGKGEEGGDQGVSAAALRRGDGQSRREAIAPVDNRDVAAMGPRRGDLDGSKASLAPRGAVARRSVARWLGQPRIPPPGVDLVHAVPDSRGGRSLDGPAAADQIHILRIHCRGLGWLSESLAAHGPRGLPIQAKFS
jgi:hypothetical protein